MIRKHLGRVALAIAVGLTVTAPIVVAAAPPAAAGAIVCGYLNDGGGAGSANSIYPSTTPYASEPFTQQNDSDAWRMCLNLSDGHLYPLSANTWCEADDSGNPELRGCNTNNDQKWFEVMVTSSTFNIKNQNGGYLCAEGGVKSFDIVQQLSLCSSYHSTWHFS